MKNVSKIGLSIFLLSMVSCSSDFLDLRPVNERSIEDFYKTEADFNFAVIAAYSEINQFSGAHGLFYSYMICSGDAYSDNTQTNRTNEGFSQFAENRLQDDNGALAVAWSQAYTCIMETNYILDRIDAADIDAQKKKQFKGEASFLRGLCYFSLVRTFGDVPLVLKPMESPDEAYLIGRSPASSVYQQIETDFSIALENLPLASDYPASEKGRATKGAAEVLLAKVHMQQLNFSGAKPLLESVINSGEYALLNDYGSLFDPENSNNRESVFEIQFKAQSPRGGLLYSVTIGEEIFAPTQKMVQSFDLLDNRRAVTIAENSGQFVINKYSNETSESLWDGDQNWYVTRYADVLLLYSECLNELQFGSEEALNAFNAVRLRAGLEGYSYETLTTNELFREALQNERFLELAYEGHRWFDLLRTGKAMAAVNAAKGDVLDEHELLFPLPFNELLLNDNLEQNPGY